MHINCHTYYSLRYGTLSVEELVDEALQKGEGVAALTDINNTSAVPDFVNECIRRGIKPVAGAEFRNGNSLLYIALARNREGLREINQFITERNISGRPYPFPAPQFSNVFVIYPLAVAMGQYPEYSGRARQVLKMSIQEEKWPKESSRRDNSRREPGRGENSNGNSDPGRYFRAESSRDRNGRINGNGKKMLLRENERIGITPAEAGKLLSLSATDIKQMVVMAPVTFRVKNDYNIHLSLRAVGNNTLLNHLKPGDHAAENELFIPAADLRRIFSRYPSVIDSTIAMLGECSISMGENRHRNKRVFSVSGRHDKELLRRLALEGMEYRYGKNNTTAIQRIEHELEIIDKLGFASYFLITHDIITYSMSRGFYHVGRGSGANSIVAYCLRITNVDPIELNLYFERFLNPKRSTPPDFDIDYSWKERDEVTRYIFSRYGRDHTALLGTINTFKDRSVVRELGKVHGLPVAEIEMLASDPAAEADLNPVARTILETGSRIAGFPNLRSIHAGGILITEEPITYFTALDMPPKGFPTTQWDMYVAEELGFEKLDILSQRGIGHIGECCDIVRENRGIETDIHAIQKFVDDSRVREYLARGETKGCFYIESPAMRGLLRKLGCSDYPTLVAASSVIRPGVARSGMMKQYIQRFHNREGFEYIHPVMKEQLSETFGVMVYQEDVLKICHHFAGLDLSDADTLRRAMSGKHRSREEIRKITSRFFENCRKKGYPEEITAEVWRQIESFAGYSFSKAHSASYAVESFQSLYLKTHYPLEFMVAVINNFGGFYRTWVYVHEAWRYGAVIHPPCVNNSRYLTSVKGNDIYLGMVHILNLERSLATSIEKVRNNRPFYSLSDFILRIRPGLEQLLLLIRTGAFRFTGRSKADLLWEAHLLMTRKKQEKTASLFEPRPKKFTLPELECDAIEDAYDEIELLGFPVSMSWFDMLKTSFRGDIMAADMLSFTGKTVKMVGHLVTVKYIKTVKKEWMNFGSFIDERGEFFDSVHFPLSLGSYPFRGSGTYLILGKIVEEFGFPSIEVQKLARLPYRPDPRY
jgi:DNA-directed DNA polymerase III PolC